MRVSVVIPVELRQPCTNSLAVFCEVHLLDTVVSLGYGAFRRCYVLQAVTAPGWKQFGIKVFEACCSLTQIGTTHTLTTYWPPKRNFGLELLKGVRPMRYLNMGKAEYNPYPNRSLPECCFLEAGIVSHSLPPDFNWMEPAACASIFSCINPVID